MNKSERYKLANEMAISSQADLRAFAKEVLLEEGIDLTMINISQEGITIKAFNKLVKSIYDVGYKEGLEQYASIKGENKRIERQGKAAELHKFLSKETELENLINKFAKKN